MSKVILVRLEVANEYAGHSDELAESVRDTIQWVWADDLNAWSVEVVNEDPA